MCTTHTDTHTDRHTPICEGDNEHTYVCMYVCTCLPSFDISSRSVGYFLFTDFINLSKDFHVFLKIFLYSIQVRNDFVVLHFLCNSLQKYMVCYKYMFK